MGHLVRNPIKHIPHKVGLFGYFSLSLASLKGYYLFKVPHITLLRQCQCLTVSYVIVLINYPWAPKHTVWVLLFGHIWTEHGSINHVTGQVSEFILSLHRMNLHELHAMCCLYFHPIIWSPYKAAFLLPKQTYILFLFHCEQRVNRAESRKEWSLYFYMCVTCSRPSTSALTGPPCSLLSLSGRKSSRQPGGSDWCSILWSFLTVVWHVPSLFVCFSCLSGRHRSGWGGPAIV